MRNKKNHEKSWEIAIYSIANYQNLLETDKVPNLVCDQPEVKIQYWSMLRKSQTEFFIVVCKLLCEFTGTCPLPEFN